MSRQFPPPSNSPLSPHPRSETPVSFRTNVNRAKTKRWVEAKKYSYDGDDWGDDEYGEYDDDRSPAPVPESHTTSLDRSSENIPSTSRDRSHPPLPSMDRSRSTDQVTTMAPQAPADSIGSAAAIIRPADIYKRMREGQISEQQAPIPAPSNENVPPVGPSVHLPPASTASAGIGDSVVHPVQEPVPEQQPNTLERSGTGPITENDSPVISLPEFKRLSGFGSNFLPDPEPSSQTSVQPQQSQESHQLEHNPSLGFRSAVHQAFDVPETPSTTFDSVGRSNSDSTTAISPIIGDRGTSEEKTPTIQEEPGENMHTPIGGSIMFVPGHRRDLSLPSPDNSPSKLPLITNPETSTPSVVGRISSETPSDSPYDHAPSSKDDLTPGYSLEPSPNTSAPDLPAPLSVNTQTAPEIFVKPNDSTPVLVPSISTEDSPQETENDRLRKEIIRSLSNTPSDQQEQESPPPTGIHGRLDSTEFDRLGSEEQSSSSLAQRFNHPQILDEARVPEASPAPVAPVTKHAKRPKPERRFSWEISSEDEDPTPVIHSQSPPVPAMPGQFPLSQESSFHNDLAVATGNGYSLDTDHQESSPHLGSEKPKLTILPPSTVDSLSISPLSQPQEAIHTPPPENPSRAEDSVHSGSLDHQSSEPPASTTAGPLDSNLLGFKDILGIQSPDERTKAFNQTRDQFAAIDTGLNHWLQVTFHAHPEYSDVVEKSSKPAEGDTRPSVPRAKFPKLSSLGNFAHSHQDGSSSAPGHIRRSSASLGTIKPQVGKDFLHTAGVLGGQAGKAAKGLFSKGRSKLKGSGGTEKVEP